MQDQEYAKLVDTEDRMWFFKSMHAHFDRELSRAMVPGKPSRILDAGCGSGGLIKYLSLRHPEWLYRGVDLSPLACELARERSGAEVLQGSVEVMPFEDNDFDAIISADVLCQVDNPSLALDEFYRLLRPGGIALLNLPAYPRLYSYHDVHCGNKRRYTVREIREQLSGAGFRGVQVLRWNSLALPAIWWRRKVMRPRSGTDVEMPSQAVNLLMSGIMQLEHAWIGCDLRWPWGSSLFVIARRPLAEDSV